ncbi:BT4734/BF3469 family protein, partial [Streptomyces caeruleatus]
SKVKINELRDTLDKERQDSLKHWLPSVCFSGTFETRTDSGLKLHSGYLVLDFDDVYEISEMMGKLSQHDFIYAAWISPRA